VGEQQLVSIEDEKTALRWHCLVRDVAWPRSKIIIEKRVYGRALDVLDI
jgi:hypothetical protein